MPATVFAIAEYGRLKTIETRASLAYCEDVKWDFEVSGCIVYQLTIIGFLAMANGCAFLRLI